MKHSTSKAVKCYLRIPSVKQLKFWLLVLPQSAPLELGSRVAQRTMMVKTWLLPVTVPRPPGSICALSLRAMEGPNGPMASSPR